MKISSKHACIDARKGGKFMKATKKKPAKKKGGKKC